MNERALKFLNTWGKRRKNGMWKYITFHILFFMVLVFLVKNGYNYFTDNVPSNFFTSKNMLKELVSPAIGGLVYGIITWFMNEKNYKRLLKKNK